MVPPAPRPQSPDGVSTAGRHVLAEAGHVDPFAVGHGRGEVEGIRVGSPHRPAGGGDGVVDPGPLVQLVHPGPGDGPGDVDDK